MSAKGGDVSSLQTGAMDSLAAAPGAQMQGRNTQGVNINKSHVGIAIDWLDPKTQLYFDPINPTTVVTLNGAPYAIPKVMVPLSRLDDSVGVWGYEFLTDGMDAGTYVLTFTGTVPGTSDTVVHTLTFTAAPTPIEQYFVGVLRAKLWDKRASRYLIDDNQRFQFQNGELFLFLDNARLKVGQTPPAPTTISWEQGYSECHDLLVTGGFIEALEAAGTLAVAQRFNYSDELTLNIDKTQYFQNAQSLRQQWLTAAQSWKRSQAFSKMAGGIGMASGRFPLYYSRILSISLSSAQNMFYG